MEEGHCWEEAQEPSSRRGLVCTQSWVGKKTAEGEGWARPGPVPDCVTAQNLWQILTFTLSELEFF